MRALLAGGRGGRCAALASWSPVALDLHRGQARATFPPASPWPAGWQTAAVVGSGHDHGRTLLKSAVNLQTGMRGACLPVMAEHNHRRARSQPERSRPGRAPPAGSARDRQPDRQFLRRRKEEALEPRAAAAPHRRIRAAGVREHRPRCCRGRAAGHGHAQDGLLPGAELAPDAARSFTGPCSLARRLGRPAHRRRSSAAAWRPSRAARRESSRITPRRTMCCLRAAGSRYRERRSGPHPRQQGRLRTAGRLTRQARRLGGRGRLPAPSPISSPAIERKNAESRWRTWRNSTPAEPAQPLPVSRPAGAGAHPGAAQRLGGRRALRDLDRFGGQRHLRAQRRRPVAAADGRPVEGKLRSGDTVGRLSGDEFAVTLSNLTRADDAGLCAQKIVHALAEAFEFDSIHV